MALRPPRSCRTCAGLGDYRFYPRGSLRIHLLTTIVGCIVGRYSGSIFWRAVSSIQEIFMSINLSLPVFPNMFIIVVFGRSSCKSSIPARAVSSIRWSWRKPSMLPGLPGQWAAVESDFRPLATGQEGHGCISGISFSSFVCDAEDSCL